VVQTVSARRSACACVCALALLGAAPAPIAQPALGGHAWTSAGIARLDADLDAMVSASPALRGAHAGIFAIDTATGTVLYAHGADDEYQPASTLKLVIGSAALEALEPDFRWHTTIGLAPGRAPEYGPAVVLTASGDPTFSSVDLREGLGTLSIAKAASVLVDDTVFDDAPYAPGWTWDDFAQDYAAPISAATLDENVVDLDVSPVAAVGAPARVSGAEGGALQSSSVPCDASTALDVPVLSRAVTGAASSDDTVDVERTEAGCPEIVGSIPLGAAHESVAAAVPRPVVAMVAAMRRDLAAGNVALGPQPSIDGPVTALLRPSPADGVPRTVWMHDSKPLGELLGPRFWIPSDNLFGELLLKELGLATGGKPGSTASGIAAERVWLRSLGIDTATVTLADGCGMSQYDRITPRDLVTILQHDWNGPNRQLVLDSLPIGGSRGTIEGIAATPAAGRVFAKTGSMMHVRGLAGYLATLRHGAVTFAFEVDEWNGAYPALAALRARVLARIVTDAS